MNMLEVVLKQTAGDIIANGITDPTEQQFHEFFLARLNRNREICERFITDPTFHDTITDHICQEVYAEIRASSDRCPNCGNPVADPKETQVGLNEFKSCEDEFHEQR